MKRIIALFLAAITICSLASCQNIETPATQTTQTHEETPAKTEENQPEKILVAEPLTKAKLDSIPIARQGMSEQELRQICADFMRLQLSFSWTPSKTVKYITNSKNRSLDKNTVYGGLPYISSTSGNLYKAFLYYDEETGVLNMEDAGADFHKIIGNQCSGGAYWAWARVTNCLMATGSQTSLQKNGCYRIGPYTYSDSINNFHEEGIDTNSITDQNGKDVMFESYAQLKMADGMVQYTGKSGHVIMAAQDAVVVRDANGKIKGSESYVLILEQISQFSTSTQSNGKPIFIQGGIDKKTTFDTLFKGGYLPYRIPELAGKDDIEPGEVSFSIQSATATPDELKAAVVTSNYPLSDATLTVKDANGNIVYKRGGAFIGLANYSDDLSATVLTSFLKQYLGDGYQVEIVCRIGNGEILPVWSGHLV